MSREEDVTRFLPLKPLEYSILVALAEAEHYGYSLAKRIAEGGAGGIRIPASNLYHVLDRLIAAGLIRATERTDPEDGRRSYFGITPLGRQVAAAETSRLRAVVATAERARLVPRREPR
jgi:DNA-binding PadR family transcriptional regulator